MLGASLSASCAPTTAASSVVSDEPVRRLKKLPNVRYPTYGVNCTTSSLDSSITRNPRCALSGAAAATSATMPKATPVLFRIGSSGTRCHAPTPRAEGTRHARHPRSHATPLIPQHLHAARFDITAPAAVLGLGRNCPLTGSREAVPRSS